MDSSALNLFFREACSRASANSCTLAKRSLGCLASALNTTCSTSGERKGTRSRKDGGGTCKCWSTTSVRVPWKGHLPQSHSYTTTPVNIDRSPAVDCREFVRELYRATCQQHHGYWWDLLCALRLQ